MSRYRLRLDGFVSVQAPYGGGELVTKPFRFKGETLEINYASSAAGELRVELQDEHGDAIDGFAAEDPARHHGAVDGWQAPVGSRRPSGANADRDERCRFLFVSI